ncbi:uncharacterized protein LOC142237979 [Haematobia irritans]|uniref:uncharacterized protein LOC142237979 n=1 Tax=Haematobia irritans TaxID=7368 RepID=UPI003F4FCCBE
MAPRNPKIHQCLICLRFHALRFCRRFLNMDIGARRREARRLGYCMNCLARSHKSYECHSEIACKDCGGEHHTLLHLHPFEKLTLEQMEGGRIPSDMRHFLSRVTSEEGVAQNSAPVGRRRSVARDSLGRRNKTGRRSLLPRKPTPEITGTTDCRRRHRSPQHILAEGRISSSRINLDHQRKMLEIALKALQHLNRALAD